MPILLSRPATNIKMCINNIIIYLKIKNTKKNNIIKHQFNIITMIANSEIT